MKGGWFVRDVAEGLWGAPLRTGLTLVSIGTGVMALSLLLSILLGLRERTRELQRDIGAEEVWVRASINGNAFLEQGDVDRLAGIFPDAVLTGVRVGETRKAPGGMQLDLLGGAPEMAGIRGWTLREGRFLDSGDARFDPTAAVVGPEVARQLNLRPGMRLALGQDTVTVVGIAEQALTVPGGLGEGRGTLWTSANNPMLRHDSLFRYDGILIQPPAGLTPEQMATRIQQDWSRDWPDAQWTVVTADRLLRGVRRMSRTVGWVYGSVAGLCLGLGGVTLGSLMTLGVRQRQREIGLRLSIGATPARIFGLFLAEGLSVTILSTGVGVVTARAMLQLGLAPETLPMAWDSSSWLLAVGIALSLGLLFSLWPATIASRIAPAEAMRSD